MRRQYDDEIEIRGYRFGVRYVPDTDHGAPWDENDGHGPVSKWTRAAKRPGQIVLHEDRGSRLYYDAARAQQMAIRDGWGVADRDGNYGPNPGETKRAYAARAVAADIDYLRAFCRGDWQYVGVVVELLDDENEAPIAHPDDISDSLWGVETYKRYHETIARELADGLMSRVEVDDPDIVLSEN